MKAIRFDSLVKRLAALAAAAVFAGISVLTFVWGSARTASLATDIKEAGAFLSELSPGDPQTHFTSAVLHEKTFEPVDLELALKEYETAAALSPNNYHLWLALGTARGRVGDTAGAEAALRRAHELAPNYARVHWALANFLLREGSDDDAYNHLQNAVAGDTSFAAPAANIALQMADGDARLVLARFKDSMPATAALAVQLAEQKRSDDAVMVWSTITDAGEAGYTQEAGTKLRGLLLNSKRYRDAISVGRSIAGQSDSAIVGQISNPGFEQRVKLQGAGEFEWRITPDSNPQIAVTDAHKNSGSFSLIAIFGSPEAKEFRPLAQTIAVEPGRAYRFEIFYRADLRSKANFFWEIVNAADGKRLALSEPLQNSAEWTRLGVRFAVPHESDGIEIRFVRGECHSTACAASGNIWFDDFKLTAE